MPELKEILKQIHQLEIKSKRLSNHVFAGEYHSAFKGRGMSFKEVREYAPGDDIRFIDWNVSARFGHPFSKVFEEERSLTLMLLLDMSASNTLAAGKKSKRELMIEIAGVLAFSAMGNNDKVGAILFTDKVEEFIPPGKGKEHVLFLLRKIIAHKSNRKGTNLQPALKLLQQTMKHTTISFLISDFYTEGFEKAMKATAVRHDCIAIQLFEQTDIQLPKNTLIPLQDAETGETIWLDTHSPAFAAAWQQRFTDQTLQWKETILHCGWDYLRFRTDHDFVPVLQQFFLKRIKRGNG
ncbi:MAG TPA: DUF58 domain-containing protein [Phnomibacter sp.]|nr:DUF58 domain-containing protein [Phnomibacter sp.]